MKQYVSPDMNLLFVDGDLVTGSPTTVIYDEIPGMGDEAPFFPVSYGKS